jgi:hypothetical protein
MPGPAAGLDLPTESNQPFLVEARADLTASGTAAATCNLTADSVTIAQRVGSPSASGARLSIALAGAATTQAPGHVVLTCTGQASAERLTLQAIRVTSISP